MIWVVSGAVSLPIWLLIGGLLGALAHADALPVRDVQGPVTRQSGVKLHGGEPVSIRLSLDHGSLVEVAAPASSTPLLSGPFLAFEAQRLEEASF